MRRPNLILLPGFLCDHALWAAQKEALADVATVAVGDLTTADSIGGMAEAILAAAPDRFALAGFSMGGYVSFEVLRRAPGRVTGLALLDTSARPDTAEQTAGRLALIERYDGPAFPSIVFDLFPRWVHPARRHDGALFATVAAMARRVGPAAFKRQLKAMIGRPDSRPGLASIAAPVLVLCGRDDGITPLALHEEIAAGITGSRLHAVSECGHLSTLEQPGAVTAELRSWLGRCKG